MIIHDFIYEWDGKATSKEKPVSWWPGSYHVRILQLGADNENISYLLNTAVILKNTKTQKPMNTSLTNYIHNFAKKIVTKYDIDISKTIWIELNDSIRVASLKPAQKMIPETLYTISWRGIRPNELKIIQPDIGDM